jgi:hypothetical protein
MQTQLGVMMLCETASDAQACNKLKVRIQHMRIACKAFALAGTDTSPPSAASCMLLQYSWLQACSDAKAQACNQEEHCELQQLSCQLSAADHAAVA